jgi:hypothetical protein
MTTKDDKVDDKVETKVEPGATDETGKYTDEGLDALVESIKADDKTDDKADDKVEVKKDDKEDDETKREAMIPRRRFDEVNGRLQALEARLNHPDTAMPDKPVTVTTLRADLKGERAAWQKAIFDNDKEAASLHLGNIDVLEEHIDQARDDTSVNAARQLSSDDIKYDNLLVKTIKDFDVIDKNSENFDQTVVNEMFEMRESYVARGYSQAEALQQSVKYILQPQANIKKVKTTTDDRQVDARKNTVDALARQPANVADLGGATDTGGPGNVLGIDITRLTMEQFDRLDEDVKVKLRGDTIGDQHLDRRSA